MDAGLNSGMELQTGRKMFDLRERVRSLMHTGIPSGERGTYAALAWRLRKFASNHADPTGHTAAVRED